MHRLVTQAGIGATELCGVELVGLMVGTGLGAVAAEPLCILALCIVTGVGCAKLISNAWQRSLEQETVWNHISHISSWKR